MMMATRFSVGCPGNAEGFADDHTAEGRRRLPKGGKSGAPFTPAARRSYVASWNGTTFLGLGILAKLAALCQRLVDQRVPVKEVFEHFDRDLSGDVDEREFSEGP